MLAFVGYLTLSGVIAGSADAMTIKATKFAISGTIPVVGGILSGIGVGYSVQVANYVGARDEYRARRTIVQAILAVLVVGFGFLCPGKNRKIF